MKKLLLSAVLSAVWMMAFGGAVEYVESSGTQHFDTGYRPTAKTRIVIDFQYVIAPSSGLAVLGGWHSSGNKEAFLCGLNGAKFQTAVSPNNGWQNSNVNGDVKRRVFDISANSQKLGLVENGRTNLTEFATSGYADPTYADATFYLFARHAQWKNPMVDSWAQVRVYGCQIFEDGELVRDFVPYIENGKFGFYESKGKQFRAASSADPLYGADDRVLGYVESTGDQHFDTGVVPTDKTRVVVDFRFAETSSAQLVVGGWQANNSNGSFLFGATGSKFQSDIASKNEWLSSGVNIDTKRRVFDIQSGSQKLGIVNNGATNLSEYATSTFSTNGITWKNQSFYLFARHTEWNTVSSWSKIRIFGCQIYENGVLIRDYVPCARNGWTGFKDRVSGTFRPAECGNLKAPFSISERDWIESSGLQYLDTRVVPDKNTRVVGDFQYKSFSDSGMNVFCGWQETDHKAMFLGEIYQGAFAAGVNAKESLTSFGVKGDTARRVFDLAGGSQKLGVVADGATNWVAETSTAFDISVGWRSSMYLFARHTQWNTAYLNNSDGRGALRLYGCRIYSGTTLIRDYQPCTADGIPGLYDKAHGVFYPSASSVPLAVADLVPQKLYYVETTGDQYFDTGVSPNARTRIVADARFTVMGTGGHQMMGWAASNPGEAVLWGLHNSHCFGGYFRMDYSSPDAYALPEDLDRHVFDFSNGAQMIDGKTYGTTSIQSTADPDQTMYAFARHNEWNTNLDWRCKMRMYSYKIYDGDTLIRDFVPALVNGRPCLFDKVYQTPYYSQGASDFIAGLHSDKGLMLIVW